MSSQATSPSQVTHATQKLPRWERQQPPHTPPQTLGILGTQILYARPATSQHVFLTGALVSKHHPMSNAAVVSKSFLRSWTDMMCENFGKISPQRFHAPDEFLHFLHTPAQRLLGPKTPFHFVGLFQETLDNRVPVHSLNFCVVEKRWKLWLVVLLNIFWYLQCFYTINSKL